jgi:hypothetical protein
MKENPVDGVIDPAKDKQRGTTPRGKVRKKPAGDPVDFSPEKIKDQASSKSTVLIQMLEREDTTYYSRHWGINE